MPGRRKSTGAGGSSTEPPGELLVLDPNEPMASAREFITRLHTVDGFRTLHFHGDDSRSAWLHDAICNLIRAGVSNELILGIITDRELGISDSVFTTRDGRPVPNPEQYARRQIENP